MIDEIFSPTGWIAQKHPNYRVRESQIQLATAVDEALISGKHLLSDAPTGVGKSYAYGIPAALHALANQTTVVIVTANLTLQEQLFKKDLPAIAELLEGKLEDEHGRVLPSLRFRSLKGMSNYLCLDKLAEVEESGILNKDYEDIVEWSSVTETGDKSELEKDYPDSVWATVAASPDDCSRDNCPMFEKCFAHKARGQNEVETPHIVVTNYHMLYTNMMVQEATAGEVSFLPSHSIVVMDEAHESTDIAMSFMGFEFTEHQFGKISKAMQKLEDRTANALARNIDITAAAFFRMLEENFTYDTLKKPLGFDGGLVASLESAAHYAEEHNVENTAATDMAKRTAYRFKAMTKMLQKKAFEVSQVAFGVASDKATYQLPEGRVYYMDRGKQLKLCCKAVKVQPFLRKHLLDNKVVIATSATLSTGGNFHFIADEIGLFSGEYSECLVPSPFKDDQTLLIVPANIPPPKKSEDHTAAVARVIEKLSLDLGGRTMALFTSYRALNQVNEYLRPRLQEAGIAILMQGEMGKSSIIKTFKKDKKYVILATSSFWQGVDIPGQALSCVVIDKFPFLPPSDPVLKYMEERLEEEGRSAFFDYSIPKAVISLKQGVGRLIRTESDYGVVVLCDNRLDTTGYGKQFMRAFPSCCYRSETGDLNDAKAFLDEVRPPC
jgi:ATP-dependent DNA helicase DinG